MTPEQIAAIHRLARDRDPFWRGAAWMLNHLQPPETPGASSCPKETR